MKSNLLYCFSTIIFISQLVSLIGICSRGIEKISFSNLDTSIQEKSIYYFYREKIMVSPIELNMEIKINEPFNASLILSDINPISGLKTEKILKISINSSKKDKSKIYLQIQTRSEQKEIPSGTKDKVTKIELPIQDKLKNKDLQYSNIKFNFFIEKNEIKILHSKVVIFSEFIDTENFLETMLIYS